MGSKDGNTTQRNNAMNYRFNADTINSNLFCVLITIQRLGGVTIDHLSNEMGDYAAARNAIDELENLSLLRESDETYFLTDSATIAIDRVQN